MHAFGLFIGAVLITYVIGKVFNEVFDFPNGHKYVVYRYIGVTAVCVSLYLIFNSGDLGLAFIGAVRIYVIPSQLWGVFEIVFKSKRNDLANKNITSVGYRVWLSFLVILMLISAAGGVSLCEESSYTYEGHIDDSIISILFFFGFAPTIGLLARKWFLWVRGDK